MRSPAAAFDTAEEAALRASADLVQAMGLTQARIYTEVPANAPTPYVVRGSHQVLIDDHDCAAEAEIFSTVTLWARTSPLDGGARARAMGAEIIAALLVKLTVAGWAVDEVELVSERYSTDPDQSTKGVIEIRYLLTEQVA